MRRATLLFLTSFFLAACGGGSPTVDKEPWGPTETQVACADLRSLTGYEFSIDVAELVPATERIPEHCRVAGRILPQIRFELLLPSAWNQRLTMYGNGRWAGQVPRFALERSLRFGDATVGTDTGHDANVEPDASFAVDRQKLTDFGYRAVHVTVVTAKRILAAYYEPSLGYSYFDGCSQGGRQGLVAAQRFPEDFDGILAGAPVLDVVGGTVTGIWETKIMEPASIEADQVEILASLIYTKCDHLDGLEDGIIDDPRLCPFDPSTDLPACPPGTRGRDCFTPDQVEALARIYSGPTVNGEPFFPGRPVGAEVFVDRRSGSRVGWEDLWSPSVVEEFDVSFFRYMAFEVPDPEYDWRSFDLDSDLERVAWLRPIMDATDPNLARFRDQGGRLLVYAGWADPGINPVRTVDYYEQVLVEMGTSTPEFFRLFTIPGGFHCGGGVGVNEVWALMPQLIKWVEEGKAPDRIDVGRIQQNEAAFTRPLCPYPQVARYRGSGNVDEAASFDCVTLDSD